MTQGLDGVDQRFNLIENYMAQGFHCINTNMQAGFTNIGASREMDPIKPILIIGGNPVPPGLPQTRGAFYSLNGTVIQTLLNCYTIVCNNSAVGAMERHPQSIILSKYIILYTLYVILKINTNM